MNQRLLEGLQFKVWKSVIGAHVLRPDSLVIQRPGWYQVITPSVPTGSGNEIVESDLSPTDADAVIDETIANYQRQGLALKWCVGPFSGPVDLAERLGRRTKDSWMARGMAIEPSDFKALWPEGVTVEEVNPGNRHEFFAVMAEGWDVPAELRSALAEDYARATSRVIDPHRLYLARHEGEPVGTASLMLRPDYGYLGGGVVLPHARGRGVYRALIAKRLQDLKHLGIPLATTHARELTSAPILEKLGFVTAFRYPIYRFGVHT